MDDEEDSNSTEPTTTDACQPPTELTWTYGLIGTIYLFIFIFGATGNSLVLFGFSRNHKLRQSISNSYMMHLAITDLLFVSTLPLWAVNAFKMNVWIFGLVACKLLRTISKINMYGSIYFLTALSVDRALAVTKPTASLAVRTKRGFRMISTSIWLGAVLLSLPELIYSRDDHDYHDQPICNMVFPVTKNESGVETEAEIEMWYLKMGLYELAKCVLGFFVPIIVIFYSYSAVLYTVQWKLIGGQSGKTRATRLAAIIVMTFIACWLPFHALSLWSALGGFLEWGITMSEQQQCAHTRVLPFAVALAYSNSAINPFLYAFTLRPFRLTLNENLHCFCSPRLGSHKERIKEYQAINVKEPSNTKTDMNHSLNTNSTSLNASVNVPSSETTKLDSANA